jgi:hypothetical protein
MTHLCLQGFSQSGFRALVNGIVVADLWSSDPALQVGQPRLHSPRPSSLAPSSLTWQALYVAVAEACAAGQPIQAANWASAFQAVATTSLDGVLLGATPVLLLNTNRYGHRQRVIQQWGQDLGLGTPAVLALEDLFQRLCQATNATGRLALAPTGLSRAGTTLSSSAAMGSLDSIQGLVQATQGQFLLALELALGQGWSGPTLGLVGFLSILTSGVAGLPAHLCHRYLASPALEKRWPAWDSGRLDQLADALFHRWAGVGSPPMTDQWTAYNG